MTSTLDAKEAIRQKIWKLLEDEGLASFPRPCMGRIPNFVGSWQASEKIRELAEFKSSRAVFCAPDYVLKRIREIVLEDGKVLAVALPHMVGFLEIREREAIDRATTINGFKRYGKPLETKVDLFVQGSVAVDLAGNRLGKGRGYGDLEWKWLIDRKLTAPDTRVVTIVHDLQIVEDFSHLMGPTDKKVNYILTSTRIIKIGQKGSDPF